MHDTRTRLRELRDVVRGEPHAVHDVEMLIHQPGAGQHVEQRRRGWLLPRRSGLDAGFVDMGEHRQSMLARQRGDAFEQFVRAALRR